MQAFFVFGPIRLSNESCLKPRLFFYIFGQSGRRRVVESFPGPLKHRSPVQMNSFMLVKKPQIHELGSRIGHCRMVWEIITQLLGESTAFPNG